MSGSRMSMAWWNEVVAGTAHLNRCQTTRRRRSKSSKTRPRAGRGTPPARTTQLQGQSFGSGPLALRAPAPNQLLDFWTVTEPNLFIGSSHRLEAPTKFAKNSEGSVFQALVVAPNSSKRMAWDVASMIVIFYELVVLPLQVFDVDQLYPIQVLRLMTTLFWMFDIPLGFISGYQRHGFIEKDLRKVVTNYIKTWFVFDIALVTLDWLMLSSESWTATKGVDAARTTKSMRMIRIVRYLRLIPGLLRTNKLSRLTTNMMSKLVQSQYIFLTLGIIQKILYVVVVNHYIACGWFLVGKLFFNGTSWVDDFAHKDYTLLYLYVVSFHWSFAQFTPAPNNCHPTNLVERAYATFVLVFGLMIFSSLLASITSNFTFLRNLYAESFKQEMLSRQYFSKCRVPLQLGSQLSACMTRNFQSRTSRGQFVVEGDVKALASLPDALLAQLRGHVYTPVITKHPLFAEYERQHDRVLFEMCYFSMRERAVAKDEDVFNAGAVATNVTFVNFGKFTYDIVSSPKVADGFEKGSWLSEMALWFSWIHAGQFRSRTGGEVMLMDILKWFGIMRRHPSAVWRGQKYAIAFANWIDNEVGCLEYVTDLTPNVDECMGLMTSIFGDAGKSGDSQDSGRGRADRLMGWSQSFSDF
mmetsp:Transcript_73288/g.203257  ORF Transcript_73288/g.203257 Transcript_73288/m.203257 type:complete len:639 (+) Transcript_73288:207-2123(+)